MLYKVIFRAYLPLFFVCTNALPAIDFDVLL
nr:MAG TPA: hypothetical protein [Caudoviricetes sp.]